MCREREGETLYKRKLDEQIAIKVTSDLQAPRASSAIVGDVLSRSPLCQTIYMWMKEEVMLRKASKQAKLDLYSTFHSRWKHNVLH